MSANFSKARAETTAAFLLLAKGWPLVFYYVYDSRTTGALPFELPDPEPDELYLSFDLAEHSEEGRKHFLEVSIVAQRLGEPPTCSVPYLGSFVTGMGPYARAHSSQEARAMVFEARREAKLLRDSFREK